jgi:hypothetical protein
VHTPIDRLGNNFLDPPGCYLGWSPTSVRRAVKCSFFTTTVGVHMIKVVGPTTASNKLFSALRLLCLQSRTSGRRLPPMNSASTYRAWAGMKARSKATGA